jgi:hypothetical protein
MFAVFLHPYSHPRSFSFYINLLSKARRDAVLDEQRGL